MNRNTIENILNFLKEKEGKEFPQTWNLIENLETHPDGVQYRFEGMLDLTNANIKKLPNDLYVDGNLYLNNSTIKKLPNKLHVEGNLILTDTSISELPDELYVAWNVFIDNTPLDKYPYDQIYEMFNSKGRVVRGKVF
jgi:hypothetical protein